MMRKASTICLANAGIVALTQTVLLGSLFDTLPLLLIGLAILTLAFVWAITWIAVRPLRDDEKEQRRSRAIFLFVGITFCLSVLLIGPFVMTLYLFAPQSRGLLGIGLIAIPFVSMGLSLWWLTPRQLSYEHDKLTRAKLARARESFVDYFPRVKKSRSSAMGMPRSIYRLPAMLLSRLGISVLFRRRFRKAVSVMATGAEKFGRGDLAHRISLPKGELTFGMREEKGYVHSELDSVVVQMNAMAENLSAARAEIERQSEEIKRQAEEIRKQQELSETLLLNILPNEVAEELKQKGAVAPQYHEDITILFTDFKGFTTSTENLAAEELVKLLNDYFTAFDRVTEKYGLEKLKTIGDSYMAVAGLPERKASHAVDAVLGAFEMVDEVVRRQTNGGPAWSVRVGVHTGPVISGVVGVRKFAFDVWGESVNFASRMESSGAPNRINLSGSTYRRVKDFFECEHRGKIATKEGREFDMYFAVGSLSSLLDGLELPTPFAVRYRTYFRRDLAAFPLSLARQRTQTASS